MNKNCLTCGKEFKSVNVKSGKGTQFCSSRCYGDGLKNTEPWNKGTGWRSKKCICKNCGKEFNPKNNTKGIYCSKKCAYADKDWLENLREASKVNKGKKMGPETIRRMSLAQGGTGVVKEKKRYYHTTSTAEYRQWRLSVFERDGYMCQSCEQIGGYLQAHHIKSWVKYEKLRYKLTNGITLCQECHKLVHKRK